MDDRSPRQSRAGSPGRETHDPTIKPGGEALRSLKTKFFITLCFFVILSDGRNERSFFVPQFSAAGENDRTADLFQQPQINIDNTADESQSDYDKKFGNTPGSPEFFFRDIRTRRRNITIAGRHLRRWAFSDGPARLAAIFLLVIHDQCRDIPLLKPTAYLPHAL